MSGSLSQADGVIDRALSGAAAALEALRRDGELRGRIARGAGMLAEVLADAKGGKVLVCGNGGSCADAMHFAEELTGRFRKDRRPLAALACADATHLTCVGNDYGFDAVFERWVTALARPGDVVIVLSTSGNSENIVRAVAAAKRAGARTIGLLGRGGGRLVKGGGGEGCELEIVVPGETSDRIQELHMLVLHAWVEAIEAALGLA